MLLTLASNLVLFLYREGSHPLKTRRVAIPCSMKSDWTPSPHSTERYLPVINTIVDNTNTIILLLTSVATHLIFFLINMEYDSCNILRILRS